MADSGGDGDAGAAAPAETGERRRRGPQEEVVDELTIETKRTNLLDQVEMQLKPNAAQVSRLLLAYGINDDRKIQAQADQEFSEWRDKSGGRDEITGFCIYLQQAGLHILEGPTNLLFSAFQFLNTLSHETSERPALLAGIKVLHFTEMKGLRCCPGWCSHVHGGKPTGTGQPLDDSNCSELAYAVYHKLLLLSLRVTEDLQDVANPRADELAAQYRKHPEMMPVPDDMQPLMSKASVDYFMSTAEFQEVFMAPFNCVLHSELLWPIPPSLAY